jgi:hypothetical protein
LQMSCLAGAPAQSLAPATPNAGHTTNFIFL